jgi:hypothetical protein
MKLNLQNWGLAEHPWPPDGALGFEFVDTFIWDRDQCFITLNEVRDGHNTQPGIRRPHDPTLK